ncbi:hypothetical protein FRB99_002247 [Tulasnella sp. 403]|nr:hypothetical protein FRB99_002247 [Tulasnella sp. 403]
MADEHVSPVNQSPVPHITISTPAPQLASPAFSAVSTSGSVYSKRSVSPSSPRTRDKFLAPFKSPSRLKLGGGNFGDVDDLPLTEDDLREIFEEEEIQRFLGAFHSRIGEVAIPNSMEDTLVPSQITSPPQKIVIVPPDEVENATKVGEVPLSTSVEPAPVSVAAQMPRPVPHYDHSGSELDDCDDSDCDDSWVAIDGSTLPDHSSRQRRQEHPPMWASQTAASIIVPFLPRGRAIEARNRRGGKHIKFSLTSLKTAGQRAYLATYPFYVPLIQTLWDTARWIDWWRSARLCVVYWVLWLHDMLLPGFLWYLVYQLIKHRLLPYPTLEQLQARRRAAMEAEQLGDALIDASSNGHSDVASLPTNISSATAKAHIKTVTTHLGNIVRVAVDTGLDAVTRKLQKDRGTVGADGKSNTAGDNRGIQNPDSTEAGDWRQLTVLLTEEVADMHERVKNIFLWRKPDSSLMYTLVLTFGAFSTMVIPARYLAKATYAALGIAYWFMVPLVCAMTRRQRAMIPPPFWDVPTDAEHAMEVMARRLATGQSITPHKNASKVLSEAYGARSRRDLAMRSKLSLSCTSPSSSRSPASISLAAAASGRHVDIEKSPERTNASAVHSTNATGDLASSLSAVDATLGSSEIPGDFPGSSSDDLVAGLPREPLQFSAQHNHLPGIITLTDTALTFTPFLRHKLAIHINLDRIRGVRKTGHFKSLHIRYIEPIPTASDEDLPLETVDNPQPDGGMSGFGEPQPQKVILMTEKEEKFRWVGQRDEVFARIVATKSHWVPV